jgi:hypothetical protein
MATHRECTDTLLRVQHIVLRHNGTVMAHPRLDCPHRCADTPLCDTVPTFESYKRSKTALASHESVRLRRVTRASRALTSATHALSSSTLRVGTIAHSKPEPNNTQGQTGSGKTHTMLGHGDDNDNDDDDDERGEDEGGGKGGSVGDRTAGLLPRAVGRIFAEVDRLKSTHDCVITLQCVEICALCPFL